MIAGCEPQFEIQSYVLPNDQGYRHMTAVIDESKDELILFGGLGNGGPFPPTPMNHDVYTLDLTEPPAARDWALRSTDTVVTSPWFTSTRGFIELGDDYYLACDDTDSDTVYAFDPDTYQFTHVSTSTLPVQQRAGDCCAVGVRITNSRNGHENGEERIYFLGGRNDFASPVAYVRYYSVTHDYWGLASDLNVGRSHLGCASVVHRGQPLVYAIGGGDSPSGVALRSMEVYDVLDDEWTLYDDYLPDGRTRLGVQSIDDRYLVLIGGDASCAGGGPGNSCAPDLPLTAIDLIDIRRDNRFLSSEDYPIPQLQVPRQTPGTALRRTDHQYELYVIGGRTIDGGALGVETSTEMISVDRRLLRRALR